MRTTKGRTAACVLAGLVFAGAAFGQEEQTKRAESAGPQLRFYKLDFAVKELENNKVINSRLYTVLIAVNGDGSSIRAGSRVMYALRRNNPGGEISYRNYDIGVNIDSRNARELSSGMLALNLNVEISSMVVATDAKETDPPPAVRNTKWSSPVLVPVRKATTVYSSDDPSGNRKMQLELSATPVP